MSKLLLPLNFRKYTWSTRTARLPYSKHHRWRNRAYCQLLPQDQAIECYWLQQADRHVAGGHRPTPAPSERARDEGRQPDYRQGLALSGQWSLQAVAHGERWSMPQHYRWRDSMDRWEQLSYAENYEHRFHRGVDWPQFECHCRQYRTKPSNAKRVKLCCSHRRGACTRAEEVRGTHNSEHLLVHSSDLPHSRVVDSGLVPLIEEAPAARQWLFHLFRRHRQAPTRKGFWFCHTSLSVITQWIMPFYSSIFI